MRDRSDNFNYRDNRSEEQYRDLGNYINYGDENRNRGSNNQYLGAGRFGSEGSSYRDSSYEIGGSYRGRSAYGSNRSSWSNPNPYRNGDFNRDHGRDRDDYNYGNFGTNYREENIARGDYGRSNQPYGNSSMNRGSDRDRYSGGSDFGGSQNRTGNFGNRYRYSDNDNEYMGYNRDFDRTDDYNRNQRVSRSFWLKRDRFR
ncbi:hypothetical protein CLV24_111140 [Pontibacter ummariensis]|uniref:Uncharacterized protein n=1 Tax=Pontibacter ummariensis TaxID=1610492 RepID=A0A239GNB3_9BACT|nr:hypothetical protein [Pontibacter ummariensis]PRY11345.1 hypothetical protein CLV24_111140 [Pontibacter ummariensis]SNS70365.1 hypothetical protein SAMN06296052_111140 [Pontibacter ummariensis]